MKVSGVRRAPVLLNVEPPTLRVERPCPRSACPVSPAQNRGLSHRTWSATLLALSLWVAAIGCSTSKPKGPALTGDPIVDGEAAIAHGPERDRVLWQYRTALAAMRRGQYDLAKQYLDEAIGRISNIYGKDPSARKARGYFQAEAKKTFIGEPYERAMAYFYRGILYWMDGEPDNARACFRSGQLMDSDTEDKTYAGDYVLFDYLDGYVTMRLGGDGTDAIKRSQTASKMWKPPDFSAKANVMVFVDYGPGPKKYATGQYAEQLRFSAPKSPVVSARIKVDDQTGKAVPYDDLQFQATTRGGRVMDHVLGNKAVFKRTTDTAGTAALVTGAVLATSNNRETQLAGLALAGAGVLTKVFSGAATPEADIRMWDNLPLYLSFVAFELQPGSHSLTVEFLNGHDQVVSGLTRTVSFTVSDSSRDTVLYVSDKTVTPPPPPPPTNPTSTETTTTPTTPTP